MTKRNRTIKVTILNKKLNIHYENTIVKELLKELVIVSKLGLPVTMIYLTEVGMAMIATIASGQYSSEDLAAVGLSNILYLTAMTFFLMTLSAVVPITSQLDGAGRKQEIGVLGRQGILLALCFSVVVILFVMGFRFFIDHLDFDPAISPIAREYLWIIAWIVPLDLLAALVVFLSTGLGKTVWPSVIALSSLPINALFTWIFVFGKFGMPEMGGAGCAVAIVAAVSFRFLVNLLLLSQTYFKQIRLFVFDQWVDGLHLQEIFKVGLPIGGQGIVMFAFLSAATILIAYEGVAALAAHQVGANVIMASFLFIHGLTIGTVIRTGNLVGENLHERLPVVSWAAITGSLISLALVACVILAVPQEIAGLYSKDPEVLLILGNLLLLALLIKVGEDPGVAMAGVLEGCKDTKMIFYCRLAGVWGIAFPVAATLISTQGIYGFWIGIAVGQFFATALLYLRMRWVLRNPEYVYGLRDGLTAN